jgi:hypothetical protein
MSRVELLWKERDTLTGEFMQQAFALDTFIEELCKNSKVTDIH